MKYSIIFSTILLSGCNAALLGYEEVGPKYKKGQCFEEDKEGKTERWMRPKDVISKVVEVGKENYRIFSTEKSSLKNNRIYFAQSTVSFQYDINTKQVTCPVEFSGVDQ